MFGVLLATISALSYGASDFSGALASKKADSTVVTVAAQLVSLLTLVAVLLVVPEDHRTLVDLSWGALGGLGAAVALVAFYRALAIGPMSTAASTTALLSATVPVVAGLLLGDRPGVITLLGIGVAVPAAVLVSVGGMVFHHQSIELSPRERATNRAQERETRLLSIVAGLGFGLFFIALSRVSPDAGLFPLLGARGASIAALGLFLATRRRWSPIPRSGWGSVGATGVLDCAANSFYLLALDHGSFVWIAAVSSMYPVSTVLLARVKLKELLTRAQLLGIAGAAAALVLITLGAEL